MIRDRGRIALETSEAERLWMPMQPVLDAAGFTVDVAPTRRLWDGGQRNRWVVGAASQAPRAVTVLAAPTEAEVSQVRTSWPASEVLAMENLAHDAPDIPWLPRLVPDYCFPPGDGADVFGATAEFRLEARPRLVYLGGYTQGAVLTRLLQQASHLLALDGELILPDSVALRAAWAPVVRRMKLAERVVFLPPLEGPKMAGVLLGADVLLALDPRDTDRSLASWGLASGTPIVAQHSPGNLALFGPAALWVYDESADIWTHAVQEALEHVPVREALTRRAAMVAEPWRASQAQAAWIQALTAQK